MIHTATGTYGFEKREAPIPNIKAGPALLQKESILAAWLFDNAPSLCACAMLFAPMGYPDSNPLNKYISAPLGRFNKYRILLGRGRHLPSKDDDSIAIIIIKGNNDGIITDKQRSTPCFAPSKASLLSNINAKIDNKNIKYLIVLVLDFKVITSVKFMRPSRKTSIEFPYNGAGVLRLKRKRILRTITEGTGLYAEPLPGVPLIEISGEDRVLIENHQSIIGYSSDRIIVGMQYGTVDLSGRGLIVECVQAERLIIYGKIDSICLTRENKE